MKRIIGWSIAIVVIVGSFLALIFGSQGGDITGNIPPVQANEWSKGNAQSKVELVEYSDFQCPACASREPLIKDLIAEFGNHIKFIYRHFPLRSLHENADITAQAAEAAGLQGKFWEMHDKIFETQNQWKDLSKDDAEKHLAKLAQELNLNTEQFKADLTADDAEDAVEEDLKGGNAAGVNSTPSFFLNGKHIRPATDEEFRSLIREAIEKKST